MVRWSRVELRRKNAAEMLLLRIGYHGWRAERLAHGERGPTIPSLSPQGSTTDGLGREAEDFISCGLREINPIQREALLFLILDE